MYILADWGVANGTFFHLVSGIYGTIARLYDVIIQVSSNSDMQTSLQISDFANTIYVLAGVFMLFRVTIGMIQMLLNPDKVTDKQVGAGKLLTRIVTCVILLWAFYPSGVLLKPYDKTTGDGGMLPRMEQAILGTNDSEGLFDTILRNKDRIGGNPFDFSKDTKAKSKSCYYFSATKDSVNYYKINFKTGQKNNSKYKEVTGSNGIYYEVVSGVMGGKNSGSGINYSSINGQLKYGGDMVTKKGNLKCPKALNKNGDHYTSSELGNSTSSIVGGYTSLKEMQKGVKKMSDGDKSTISKLYSSKDKIVDNVLTALGTKSWFKPFAKLFVNWKIDGIAGDIVDYPLLTDLENRDTSLAFAQTVAASFQECTGDDTKECHEVQDRMFGSTGGDHDAVELIGNGKLNIDFFFSWFFGLAIIIYLIFLIVDIIIRKFKLVLLEFLSPIPIVCYADPSDKVFNRWLKMYFSTYVDIFIKLFALNVALILLSADLIPDGSNILLKILYIVAILVFAKVVPSMLSKLFGLDSIGGSFKDIGKMFKRGAGIGAGAAVGGAIGGITGGFAGALTGVARGAGAGFKGDFTGNASGIADYNRNLKFAKTAGSTAGGRLLTRLGINNYAAQKRKIDIEKANLAEKKAKDLEEIQRRRTANDNTLSNIAGFEKRVEGQFDKHKYDGKGIQAVDAYRKADAELSAARASGDADRIEKAESAASAARGRALDDVKEYEIGLGANGDKEAQAYLATLGQSVVAKGFKDGIDAQKKNITADNVDIKNKISQFDISYTVEEQAIAAKERALENSASKANFDAVKDLDKK